MNKQSVVSIRLSVSYWKSQSNKASFPGLPRSYLLFAFTIIHGSRRAAKNGEGLGAFIMAMTSGRCEVDVGGWGVILKIMSNVLNLKASFLPVKMSSFDHAEVWSPKLW